MKKNDLVVLSHLRKNARRSLVELSKDTGIPASTIYDRVNVHEKKNIKKYTALLNFNNLGFHGRTYFAIKLDNLEKRRELLNFLVNSNCINSLYKVNFGYHYLFEAVFRNVAEAELFISTISEKYGIDEKKIFTIVDEIKKEDFLTKPEHFDIV